MTENLAHPQFSKGLSGYKAEEVDAYIEKVLDTIRDLKEQNEVLEDKIGVLAESLQKYREDEDSLREALLGAQKMGDSIIKNANNKAEITMREASVKAAHIVEEARKKVEDEKDELIRVQTAAADFKAKLIELYREHIELVTKIPVPESAPAEETAEEPAKMPAAEEVTEETETEEVTEATAPEEAAAEAEAEAENAGEEMSLTKTLVLLVLGAVLIALGANLLVDNGTLIAQALGVPESVIALTFVALGTSLPELVTAITSLVKGCSDLSLGNIVGANVFNLVLVSGMSVTLAPFTVPQSSTLFGINSSLVLEIPVMLAVMMIMTLPALKRGRLSRAQGIILLCIYAAFCAIQFTM